MTECVARIKLTPSGQKALPKDGPVIQRVEVPLTFDVEFFELLQGDVTNLNMLQAGEQKRMTDEIVALSTEVTNLTKPSKFSKTDLYRWRELFDIYLQAGIFFSTHELDHGSRDSTVALRQLEWFQREVTKRRLVDSFKLPASRQALNRFISINVTLLWNLKFQEINQKAITKILKSGRISSIKGFSADKYLEFDKKTKLGATRTFPKLIQSESIMSETMGKAVCSQMTQDLVKVVPQLDDYLCPICFTIFWRPIRMKCRHIFCIRCAVLMQRERKRLCPLCRGKVIMEADEGKLHYFHLMVFPYTNTQSFFPVQTLTAHLGLPVLQVVQAFAD
jgi:E3 ubiquitin-protein ligase BAH